MRFIVQLDSPNRLEGFAFDYNDIYVATFYSITERLTGLTLKPSLHRDEIFYTNLTE